MYLTLRDSIIFGIIFVITSFIVSYLTDLFTGKDILWWPDHGIDMATGTFISSIFVFIMFSDYYVNYRKSLE